MTSEETQPKRTSVAKRVANSTSSSNSAGGVTATPNTGSIPRITAPLSERGPAEKTVPPSPSTEKLYSEPSSSAALKKARGKRGATIKPGGAGGKPKRQKGSLSRRGWIPDQHGAWAMVLVPFISGIYLSGPVWQHLILAGSWLVGYFAFFAIGLWLRSNRRERYWPPVRVYGLITIVFLVLLVAFSPAILEWAPIFLVLIAIAAWQSVRHQERSLLARSSTVIAAGLMTPVAYDMGTDFTRPVRILDWLHDAPIAQSFPASSPTGQIEGWAWVWIVTFCLTAYYWNSIPYVKTLIRERESVVYLVVSATTHTLCAATVIVLAYLRYVTYFHAIVWVALTIRAIIMPLAARQWGVRWRPKIIGWGEVLASVFVVVSLLFL